MKFAEKVLNLEKDKNTIDSFNPDELLYKEFKGKSIYSYKCNNNGRISMCDYLPNKYKEKFPSTKSSYPRYMLVGDEKEFVTNKRMVLGKYRGFYIAVNSSSEESYLNGNNFTVVCCLFAKELLGEVMITTDTLRMPFGKHKGELISEIDKQYLKWVLENCKLSRNLKYSVELSIGED